MWTEVGTVDGVYHHFKGRTEAGPMSGYTVSPAKDSELGMLVQIGYRLRDLARGEGDRDELLSEIAELVAQSDTDTACCIQQR